MRNARFIPDYPYSTAALLLDLGEGLRCTYEGQDYTIPWSITYQALEELPFVEQRRHDRFGWPVYSFNAPLVIGILEVEGLQVNIPDKERQPAWRLDVPLDTLPFEVRLAGDGADNYWQLKAYFQAALGEPVRGWERDDQLHADWEYDGLHVGLTYWLKSSVFPEESGYASLNIRNERFFPPYFTDSYTENFNLHASGLVYETFEVANATLLHHYRTTQWVRFTPAEIRGLLQNDNRQIAVWYDPQAMKLGFAQDEQLCKIVQLTDNQSFVLQLIDHDRGIYAHEIRVQRPDQTLETVLSGEVGSLDGIVRMLASNGFQVLRAAI